MLAGTDTFDYCSGQVKLSVSRERNAFFLCQNERYDFLSMRTDLEYLAWAAFQLSIITITHSYSGRSVRVRNHVLKYMCGLKTQVDHHVAKGLMSLYLLLLPLFLIPKEASIVNATRHNRRDNVLPNPNAQKKNRRSQRITKENVIRYCNDRFAPRTTFQS